MKITTEGSTISMNFETDGVANVVVDVNAFNADVQRAAMLFGFQTALRNATAGKLEELDKALNSVNTRIATWAGGSWLSVAEAKAAIELTDDERAQVIGSVIVMARRAQGDTRTDADIVAAFQGLSKERQDAVLKALEKPIDKRLKDALRQKKVLAKSTAGSAVSF